MGSRVFVVQRQKRFDQAVGDLVDKYDISSAKLYGEIVYLLSPSAAPFKPEPVVTELRETLADFTEQDYLLLIGNPALIGYTVSVATEALPPGVFPNVLQWSGKEQSYIAILGPCLQPHVAA